MADPGWQLAQESNGVVRLTGPYAPPAGPASGCPERSSEGWELEVGGIEQGPAHSRHWLWGARAAESGVSSSVLEERPGVWLIESVRDGGVGLRISGESWERYYGLGERFTRLELSGTTCKAWVSNHAAGNVGYKPMPLVYSSAYYGLAITSPAAVTVSIRSEWADGIAAVSSFSRMRAYLVVGSDYRELFRRFGELFGTSAPPPLWWLALARRGLALRRRCRGP